MGLDTEDTKGEMEDRRRGRAAAFAWLDAHGTDELIQHINAAENHPCNFLRKLPMPPEVDWASMDHFTSAFLTTLITVARTVKACDDRAAKKNGRH